MNIIQRFIPASNKSTRPGTKMVPKYITIHETDNTSARANAEAHARLQENGNPRQASWHLQVDDTYCIQSVPFDEVAWAAGDGGKGPGNTTSIHIEMCVNSDGDYLKTVKNTAEVVRDLMNQFNIPLTNVVQHNKWSGKNCPSQMRSGKYGVTWESFNEMCKGSGKDLSKQSTMGKEEGELKLEDVKVKAEPTKGIGVLKVIEGTVLREDAVYNADITGRVEAGGEYIVHEYKNGWYRIGGWIYSKHVNFLPCPNVKMQ